MNVDLRQMEVKTKIEINNNALFGFLIRVHLR